MQQVIGLGKATAIRSIEIRWPRTGKVQIFKDIQMDQIVKIREGEATPIPIGLKKEVTMCATDATPERCRRRC